MSSPLLCHDLCSACPWVHTGGLASQHWYLHLLHCSKANNGWKTSGLFAGTYLILAVMVGRKQAGWVLVDRNSRQRI